MGGGGQQVAHSKVGWPGARGPQSQVDRPQEGDSSRQPASNGVAHIIDGVLLPPAAPTPPDPKAKNIVELAQSVPSLSTLVTAVVAGDLAGTLSSPGHFTVFAPTNEGFAKLPAGTVDSLLKPENKAQLVDILTYHVLPEQVYSSVFSQTKN